jgi:3-oxoacyl-[acyl-carrier-protein] synthase II
LATLSSIELLSVANDNPQKSYRPFSKDAAGFVLGEGAAVLVLEELEHALRRDARIYAEVVGFGLTTDAYHVMLFAPDFQMPVAAIRAAVEEANLRPEDLGYINPHGIAIPDNDRGESTIFQMALGEAVAKIPVSATKPLTGHTLGAGGALELAGCCLMLQHEFLHPMINLPDPNFLCNLNFISDKGVHRKVDAMLSVSFGFGGYNATCVLKRYYQ